MTGLRIGSLCSGYGGLEEGVREVLGGTVAWHSEIDPGARKILAHRYPGVPDLGDMTAVDWSNVEPVDVLCGGTPCQDLSHAGKRAGMTEGTRSNLWVAMREAIAVLRPGLVVWENVRGAYSARADSELESREGRMGVGGDGPVLRALGRVLGDLSELGFDAEWVGLRAADVGAPHGRFRVFVAAWPAANSDRLGHERGGRARHGWPGPADGGRGAADAHGAGQQGAQSTAGRDLPDGRTPAHPEGDGWHEGRPEPARLIRGPDAAQRGDAAADTHRNAVREQPVGVPGRGGATVTGHAGADAPADAFGSGRPWGALVPIGLAVHGTSAAGGGEGTGNWGPYTAAIHRWERTLGRVAPPPTEPGRNGQPRLSPTFVEFLMGLPAGWVTGVPDLSRNEALKALGNGVVPAQAAEALRRMLPSIREAAA